MTKYCHSIALVDGHFEQIGDTFDALKKWIKIYANWMASRDEYRHDIKIRFWFNDRAIDWDVRDDDDVIHQICFWSDYDQYKKYGKNIIKFDYTCL